jgi:hypothetical protein
MSVKMTQPGGHEFEATASVLDGEDAAIGAFRFSEEYNFHQVEDLLHISATLEEKLTGVDYTPPIEVGREFKAFSFPSITFSTFFVFIFSRLRVAQSAHALPANCGSVQRITARLRCTMQWELT